MRLYYLLDYSANRHVSRYVYTILYSYIIYILRVSFSTETLSLLYIYTIYIYIYTYLFIVLSLCSRCENTYLGAPSFLLSLSLFLSSRWKWKSGRVMHVCHNTIPMCNVAPTAESAVS